MSEYRIFLTDDEAERRTIEMGLGDKIEELEQQIGIRQEDALALAGMGLISALGVVASAYTDRHWGVTEDAIAGTTGLLVVGAEAELYRARRLKNKFLATWVDLMWVQLEDKM